MILFWSWIRALLFGRREPGNPWTAYIIRFSVGFFFLVSGGDKLLSVEHHNQMLKTMMDAHILFPLFMSYFVSAVECIAGFLLLVGFLVVPSALALIVDMVVALFAVQLASIPPHLGLWNYLDWVLYLPETLYILMLMCLICNGSGTFSLDFVAHQRMGKR